MDKETREAVNLLIKKGFTSEMYEKACKTRKEPLCDCGKKATIIKGGFQLCQSCYDEIMFKSQEPYNKETVL